MPRPSSRPIGDPSASCPRSQVRRTTPVSSRPAYGVTGLRWCRSPTVNRSSGAKATRSASRPTSIAPLRGSPASRAGRLRHPPDDVGQLQAPRACAGPDRGQGHLQRGDATPGQPEVADVGPLELGRAGRVVADHEVDVAVAQRRPERLAVPGLADRRAALERRRPVGNLLRGEGEVVRAGLDGDPHALGAGPAQHRDARRRRRGGRRAPAPRCPGRRRSAARWPTPPPHPAGRRGSRRTRGRPRRGPTAITSASSACAMSSPSKAASSVSAARSPASSSGGNSGTPESSRKHLNPTTPASCSGRSWSRLPGTAPPQNATSAATWPFAACRFTCNASTVVVGGMELRGMSTIAVTPPATAARVALAKPSHSVRPGSLTCTWLSTRPGRSTSSSARVTAVAGASSNPVTAVMRPSSLCTAAGPLAAGQHHPPGPDDQPHAGTRTTVRGSSPSTARSTRCSSVPQAVVTQPPGIGSRTASSPVRTSTSGCSLRQVHE